MPKRRCCFTVEAALCRWWQVLLIHGGGGCLENPFILVHFSVRLCAVHCFPYHGLEPVTRAWLERNPSLSFVSTSLGGPLGVTRLPFAQGNFRVVPIRLGHGESSSFFSCGWVATKAHGVPFFFFGQCSLVVSLFCPYGFSILLLLLLLLLLFAATVVRRYSVGMDPCPLEERKKQNDARNFYTHKGSSYLFLGSDIL